jgi:hypothetical protein
VQVLRVPNIRSPQERAPYFNARFRFSLNKLHAWRLLQYDRVVMLDADNLFLREPWELFLCGQFCAAFIDPCIFHTGLFVLQVRAPTLTLTLNPNPRKKHRSLHLPNRPLRPASTFP